MAFNATIEINDQGLREHLARLQERLTDLTPVMREISEIMIEASQRAFAEKRDPETGKPWKELATSTNAYRARHGRSPQNILQFSGLLKSSIGSRAMGVLKIGPFEAIVGTNVPYAAVHQLGAKIQHHPRMNVTRLRTVHGRTLFAKKSHKRKRTILTFSGAYQVKIEARPFLGVDATDIGKMKTVLKGYLLGE